ncbi:hypothetical protein RJ639_032420 [Escallonia herrerae]|uniref:Glycosyltransferase n=1 Tax=Escallonia herrerae TaxID=1293975 RepID=A0AA89BED1_9ASTE|nr:hypothetical protein RJ639_032420 [Escallonia herrerae]
MASVPSLPSPQIVLFPFMSKGHTIPVLHLSRLLLHRGATVTVFTTPANRPFISNYLSDTDISIIDLPYPENVDGIPPGIESTDKHPSMSLFVPFASATELMQPHFEEALKTLPRVAFMITDGFLGWTVDSATKFNIPRLVFYGMNNFAMAVSRDVSESQLLQKTESDTESFAVPHFPWIKLTRNDFSPPFTDREPSSPHFEWVMQAAIATTKSHGLVVNSFYELEPLYLDYWNREFRPKAWCVGPLCLSDPVRPPIKPMSKWMQWLDQKLAQGSSVLFVAFGSQVEISEAQFEEIKIGLEKSGVNFLWVVRMKEPDEAFEERVKDRGMVVREWVDQRGILEHKAVKGFLSHCGWNSVIESICAKVPILAWPFMAEQPLNARMVVEEIKVGLRVETCAGSVRGFVKWEGLEKMVKELMEGEMGKVVRRRVDEVGETAVKAVEEGGSSWCTLNELIDELHAGN